jgi:hypothetical protein
LESKAQVLLNTDGLVFGDLAKVSPILEQLTNEARVEYRDVNATAIASSTAKKLLVVAGPGTGKSYLFLSRIEYWVALGGSSRIRVASFVRKLVTDLRTAISTGIAKEQQNRIQVTTLHTLARSVIERSGGTSGLHLGPHIRVIDSKWAWVVWGDVLEFQPELRNDYQLADLQRQFRTEEYQDSGEWHALRATYNDLCSFFNAVGFEYLIVLARDAVEEQSDLVDAEFWIVDEYQDFNRSEDHLVKSLTSQALGVVLAGDDDQALYQALKDSHPEIMAGYYADESYANALLPFCSRSSYYICMAAAAFIAKHRARGSILKIYLPLKVDESASRIQVVATAFPDTAVEYVRKFLADNREELSDYLEHRVADHESDPFLLILTPGAGRWLTRCGYGDLQRVIGAFATGPLSPSEDYIGVVVYARAGWNESDNFAIRKVLHLEGTPTGEVHVLITQAMKRGSPLVVLVDETLPEVADRFRKVAAAVDKYADDVEHLVSELVQLVYIVDPNALTEELKRNPIKKSTHIDEQEEPVETAGLLPPVVQMTIVGSKGLSARHVIVLGCDDVNMKVTELAFFVALTRARKSLHLVVACHSGGAKQAHQFLFDLPANCCEYVAFTKTNWYVRSLDGQRGLQKYFQILEWVAKKQAKR